MRVTRPGWASTSVQPIGFSLRTYGFSTVYPNEHKFSLPLCSACSLAAVPPVCVWLGNAHLFCSKAKPSIPRAGRPLAGKLTSHSGAKEWLRDYELFETIRASALSHHMQDSSAHQRCREALSRSLAATLDHRVQEGRKGIHRRIPRRPAQCLAHGIYQILVELNEPSQNNHHTGRVVLCSSQFSPWVPPRFHPADHTPPRCPCPPAAEEVLTRRDTEGE